MNKRFLFLILLCVIQIQLLYGKGNGMQASTLGLWLFVVQLCIAIGSFFVQHKSHTLEIKPSNSIKIVWMSIVSITILLSLNVVYNMIQFEHIETSGSDIIPQIEIMCKRLMNHQFPYQIIHFNGYDMNPTYMPFQWLMYCPAMWLGIDIRLMASIFLGLSTAFACYWYMQKSKFATNPLVTLLAFTSLLILPFALTYQRLIFPTVEQGIAACYLLIPILLALKKYHWVSFMICICLLSRYSILFWVPLYLIGLFIHDRKLAIQQFLIIAVGVMAVYVLPFMSIDLRIFLKGYQYHSGAALGEWNHLNEQQLPFHLYNGQGLAFLFYSIQSISVEARLLLLQKVHLIVSGGSIVVMLLWYKKIRTKISMDHFFISSFMVYITLFYTLIQIPYKYLFIVPVVVLIGGMMSLSMIRTSNLAESKD